MDLKFKKIFVFIHKKLNKPLYYLVVDKTTSLSSMINVFTLKKQKLKLQILIFSISLFNLKILIFTYIYFFSTFI